MHWVLQSDVFREAEWAELCRSLERLALPYSVHALVPFTHELLPTPAPQTRNVMCMGSYAMRSAAKRERWFPGVFDLERYDFSVQLAHWGDRLLNAFSVVSRFADARFDAEDHFVRPVADSKTFTGRVMTRQEFEAWQEAVCVRGEDDGSSLTPDTLVQVATPRVVHAEVRCWVVRGEVVTASVYKRGQRPFVSADVPPAMVTYAEQCLAQWQPLEAFVLDVCETSEGPRVVEINTLNAAGFYAADLQRLAGTLDAAFSD